jgi:UDP:flavonoid glycosyltransferase YjiC (YdhE family)
MIAAAVLTHETMGTVKIMFASLGAYGHLYPMMPLAIACADAGQEVVIATGKPFLERLPVTRRRHPDLHGGPLSMAMT